MSEASEPLQTCQGLGPACQWVWNQIIALRLENRRRQEQLQKAQASHQKLEHAIEELQRQAHRSAAPFRRAQSQRSAQPGRPGRKKGHPGRFRPAPAHLDEVIDVPLENCPHCGSPVCARHPQVQYIEEIPEVRPRVNK
jgi:hypothetical protein